MCVVDEGLVGVGGASLNQCFVFPSLLHELREQQWFEFRRHVWRVDLPTINMHGSKVDRSKLSGHLETAGYKSTIACTCSLPVKTVWCF